MKIGFIGQGFIGSAYADDFERRGYEVVRYARSEPFIQNKDHIAECGIVFIAVPTPTTPEGFDDHIVREVVGLVGRGKTAVIKSTMLPGSTESIQEQHPEVFVMHSPEFLREKSAAEDAAHPMRNIVGIPKDTDEYRSRAQQVIEVLPKASFEMICSTKESELLKYVANSFLYMKVVYANLMYDLAEQIGADWKNVRDGVAADPRIGPSHLDPVHASGISEQVGRGAGGNCFIKDFAALTEFYEKHLEDASGLEVLKSMEKKNNELLRSTGKDLDLLEGVYGAS